ncbi:MAG TPA: hypothetical protein VN648_10615, partial [Candidatus Methylomirabilis sp.]|nr:hypothetical protein [Candidatus Methylomirabilis sp.]
VVRASYAWSFSRVKEGAKGWRAFQRALVYRRAVQWKRLAFRSFRMLPRYSRCVFLQTGVSENYSSRWPRGSVFLI